MKNAIKLALAGAALVAGVAQAGPIASVPGNGGSINVPNGSSLVLFATDYTNPTNGYFFVDLGVQIGSLVSLDTISGATTGVTNFDVTGISSSAIDAFTAWAGARIGDTIKWSILASERNGTGNALGSQSAAFTSATDFSSTTTPTNANVNTFASATQTFFNFLNTNADTADGLSSTNGWDGAAAGGGGNLADNAFLSASFPTGALLGQTMSFWVFAENSTTSGGTANKYLGAQLTLTAAGLSIVNPTSEVPLPAAVWLFGSGLLGLAGVGRRKKVA